MCFREFHCNARSEWLCRPESRENVGVDSSPHLRRGTLFRKSSTQALISFSPPRNVPTAPLYFSDGFCTDRAGRMAVRSPSTTNSTGSPVERPRRLRICCGTVIWPLLLIVLEFF